MKEKGFVETFAYIAFATSEDKDVAKWIKSHKSDIQAFYDWSSDYNWDRK